MYHDYCRTEVRVTKEFGGAWTYEVQAYAVGGECRVDPVGRGTLYRIPFHLRPDRNAVVLDVADEISEPVARTAKRWVADNPDGGELLAALAVLDCFKVEPAYHDKGILAAMVKHLQEMPGFWATVAVVTPEPIGPYCEPTQQAVAALEQRWEALGFRPVDEADETGLRVYSRLMNVK